MIRRTSTTVLAAIAVCAASAFVTANAQAQAATITCGATITVDTTLHADLLNCPNLGLVIGADNIVLDLNGHSLTGDAASTGCDYPAVCDVGVDNSAGHHGLTIERGTVRNFSVGLLASGEVTDLHLREAALSHNQAFGAVVFASRHSVIERNTFAGNGTSGLVLIDGVAATVNRNTVTDSRGYGIVPRGVTDSVINNNTLDHNDHGILGDASSRNTVHNNIVTRSGGSSIDFGDGATANRIEHNHLINNGDGIIGTNANNNVISHNIVTDTGIYGFPDTGGFGLLLDGSGHNTVERNIITGGRGPAIFVSSLDSPTASVGNTITGNIVNSRLDSGILVNNNATRTSLTANLAHGSGHDGIQVDAPDTTITANTATHNHDLGIEAVPGVTDGGANHAAANGNPIQCTNIAC